MVIYPSAVSLRQAQGKRRRGRYKVKAPFILIVSVHPEREAVEEFFT